MAEVTGSSGNDLRDTVINAAERFTVGDPHLKGGDDGGTVGGMTDDWKKDVERRLAQLHNDIRGLIVGIVGLASMIAGLYLYTNSKFENVSQRLSALETQQAKDAAVLNGKLDVIMERLPKSSAKD